MNFFEFTKPIITSVICFIQTSLNHIVSTTLVSTIWCECTIIENLLKQFYHLREEYSAPQTSFKIHCLLE
uniref:Uncharacterized protein n=1 Tax=Trichobilharzia regenti TaxID=157069 RepID=A0AA85JRL0_TRIRE|nr:unnamed protein product [Trichobilharzia regenti]